MRKGEFWFLIGAWYLILAGIVAAGVSRFGSDYIINWLTEPSIKAALFLGLVLVPVPFAMRRWTRS
jgi:hypothetical protein